MEAIPTPKGYPLIGNVLEIDPHKPNQSLDNLFAIHGPIIRLFLPCERTYVANYELAKELFDESRFVKAVTGPLAQVRELAGDGLFTAIPDEHNWELAHRLLMPAFGPLPIKDMFPEMQDIVSQMVLKWARSGPDHHINVPDDFTRLTLDSIAICAMGTRFNSFYHEEQHEFVNSMVTILAECFTRSRRPPLPKLFFKKQDKAFQEEIDKLVSIAEELLASRRKNPTAKKDLLNAMIKNKDPKTGESLDDQTIIRNMITFLIAGHETTSGLLSFLFYELLANPEALATAQAEIDTVIGKEPITVEHMGKLPYIEGCLRETLRLHPTAPAFTLQAKGDQVLGGRYKIQDNQVVTVFLSGLHRDKAVYGPDAEFFKPDRMVGEKFSELPPGSWKPFGNGVRACIGRPFAWQESILTVATLLQNFNFTKANPSYQLEIKTALTIKPEEFYMKARLRHESFLDHAGALASGPVSEGKVREREVSGAEPTENLKPMQIFFGSNTGTCEAVANALAASAQRHGFKAEPVSMDDGVALFDKNQPLVVVTASYEGQPPDNAAHFVEWLSHSPKDKVEGVKYAVFGLGNKEWYSTYQKVPTLVDEAFAKNGGVPLTDRVALNVTEGNVFDALDEWTTRKLWPSLGSNEDDGTLGVEEFKVQIDPQKRGGALKQELQLGQIVETQLLTKKPGAPRKRHLSIALPSGTTYQTGDYLAVLPLNSSRIVQRVLRRFKLPWDAMLTIDPKAITSLPKGQQLSAHDILGGMVELSQPITAKALSAVKATISDEEETAAVDRIASDARTLSATSLLEILELCPSSSFSFGAFLASLPAMRVRQYSISSSPLADPSVCTLTYSIIDAPPKSGSQGGHFHGVCSTYLERLSVGDTVQVGLRPSRTGFNVPADDERPMIMACAGTGLAPFRAFIQERAIKQEAGRKIGPALLFYGMNAPDEDDMYRDQFDEWEKRGVVSVRRAFSHANEQSEGCTFVQDRIWHDREQVLELFRRNAALYFCGAGIVGSGVDKVIIQIRIEQVKCSEEEAKKWVSEQKGERYWADTFA
ncbi:putative P450 monooxygenase [Fusarium flagelliforme]|uniref:putative P450 monooxygenase n=1 Tax=Fusarium flagelliforme TaxID=2675880 RepID=UPI001E8DEE0F|nr:putative P450 monooxygenase [Fusarium flagelliforme]KAH7182362.1 putative P450 monooxygenase [Fusarium flagelliforme]